MKQSRLFELEYCELEKMFYDDKWEVTSPGFLPDLITGQKREIDVLIIGEVNGKVMKIGIEYRDRGRVQGTSWIEEFVTKKNDTGLDVMVLVSSSGFNQNAIIKANYYNIFLERAERVNKDLVDELFKMPTVTFLFLRHYIDKLMFIDDYGKRLTLKNLLRKQDQKGKNDIINELNSAIYMEVCAISNAMMNQNVIDETIFFVDCTNTNFGFTHSVDVSSIGNPTLFDINIRKVNLEIIVYPIKSTMILSGSLATFDPGTNKKNRYHGKYENSDGTFNLAYNESTKLIAKLNFKYAETLMFRGMKLFLNTVIPIEKVISEHELNQFHQKFIGKFDLSKFL